MWDIARLIHMCFQQSHLFCIKLSAWVVVPLACKSFKKKVPLQNHLDPVWCPKKNTSDNSSCVHIYLLHSFSNSTLHFLSIAPARLNQLQMVHPLVEVVHHDQRAVLESLGLFLKKTQATGFRKGGELYTVPLFFRWRHNGKW